MRIKLETETLGKNKTVLGECIEEVTANYRNWRSPRLHENTVELRTLSVSNLMAPYTWTTASMPLEVENSGPSFHHDVCTAAFSKRVSAIKMLSVLLKA